jgi:predicted Zn-dependent protease
LLTDEHDSELLRLLGMFYMQSARPERAATLYRALARLEPQNPAHAKALAFANLTDGNAVVALEILDSIVAPGEPSAEVHLMRAQALAALNRGEDAQVSMRAFQASRPKAAESRSAVSGGRSR